MRVFVSHSHKDVGILHKLKRQMFNYGIDFFLAHEDIEYGENGLERIKKEVLKCNIFLIIGNEHSKQSEYCNQEIGMAIAHKKTIISTVHTSLSPWGFIQIPQAIKYKDILTDLPLKLHEQITKLSEYKKFWKLKLQSLDILKIKGFSVNNSEVNYINLQSDNFNDYGYLTIFHIRKENTKIGYVKIGYENQTPEKPDTKDILPEYFPFLRDNFFSYIELKENVLPDKEKQSLYYLLNDVRYNEHLAKKYINEEVLINSFVLDPQKKATF